MFKGMFDSGKKELKRAEKLALEIEKLASKYSKLTDDQIRKNTEDFKKKYQSGVSLDKILVEAFANAREASKRVTGMTPYKVQLIGGIAIHGGNVAEMKTGEGKSLTAVLPAYLNAITGKGVHVITVNEYLASREAVGEIADIYKFLGLTVGLNIREKSKPEKKEAYLCDIVYSTNSEIGFDYLRDNMVTRIEEKVQRELNYCIIDECDSILIDEARTPLIISGGEKNTAQLYIFADKFVKSLKDNHYDMDIETKHVALTEEGIKLAEKSFGIKNLYDIQHVQLTHHINNALRANLVMNKDVEYVVEDGAVQIVDQFTGRILQGRQYSDGLHQAIEAKENVEIKKETRTMASITYQNLFRMYNKLSGMTGTAKTEEEEFMDIYNMYVIQIPTNKPVIRKDEKDRIFYTKKSKYEAVANEVKELNDKGQPVLIGTVAVESSEIISSYLTKLGLKHEVLNAKNHFREAEIILNAGQKGAITIATNMAGRGTDIKLGEGVVALGGLAVIGTERHESRRIDDQLRGRSGRQGDPGYSRFYLATDDELLQRFGDGMFKKTIASLTGGDTNSETGLDSKMMSWSIKNAQKKIEGFNYDSRKNVLKYDEVLRKQREIIYSQRDQVLVEEDVDKIARPMIKHTIEHIIDAHTKMVSGKERIDHSGLIHGFNNAIFPANTVKIDDIKYSDSHNLNTKLYEKAEEFLDDKKNNLPADVYKQIVRSIILKVVDQHWTTHLDAMAALRKGVSLQSYGQGNPLLIYQEEGFRKFSVMNESIARQATVTLIRSKVEKREVPNPTSQEV